MKKFFTKTLVVSFLLLCSLSIQALAQTAISGKVVEEGTGEPLAGVNIIVKGKVIGTITNANGEFNLQVNDAPPLVLVFSFIGFESKEIQITNASTSGLEVSLAEQTMLGQEVVISASRVEESILESPVSIEKMDILAVQNTASDDYYKGIANLKGVDVASSSINFQIINARGFASTGNTRFVQLTDGMDTQAPALNFPIGNLNGPSELDVESVELIPGAASALYGPNAFNGILLVNSKSPFEYQGASAMAKIGVNHVGSEADQDASPMYNVAVRYAKAYNNKFAFKVNFAYSRADDWHGTSTFDRNANLTPEGFPFNPGPDRLHYMGDEASLNMNILRFSATTPGSVGWQTLASSGAGFYSSGQTAWLMAQNGFLPNHVVSAPGYREENIVDYGAENIKGNVGLFYRLNDKLELSYLYNGGFGTSVYTGAQRYSLSNFEIQQHRLQLRSDNFFVRAYTTREKSGDSYIAEFLGKKVNDVRFGGDVSNYLTQYPLYYLEYLYNQGYRKEDDPNSVTLQQQIAAHEYARDIMLNQLYPLDENSERFNEIKESQINGVVPFGPKFDDASNLYHVEGQYDFKNEIDFMELQMGGSYRIFSLNSNGTIFDDKGGLTIKEYGAYVQASKRVIDNLKLTGSLRYDKNENFDGQFNPRISGVLTIAENHNIRGSFQTGFRIPTTQGQYIDLDILTARLLGGLPQSAEKYNITENAYTRESVNAYTSRIFATGTSPTDEANIALLVPFTEFDPVKPEQVKSFEIGYKSLIANKLMIDLAYYYNIYNDFITQIQVRKASADVATNPAAGASLLNGTSNNTFQIYTNFDQEVSSQGAALGLTYNLPSNFTLNGNYTWSKLNDEIENGLSEFNTPEHKFNISFANRKLTDKLGFNITYRWQEAFEWESSFAQGPVPSYSTLDAQVSYKLKDLKSIVKLGGSNVLNDYYIQSLGGPNIGGIYYISVTFDELMN